MQAQPSQGPPGECHWTHTGFKISSESEDYFQTEQLKLHLKKTCGLEKQDYTVSINMTRHYYCLSRYDQHPEMLTLKIPAYRWLKAARQMDPGLPFCLERRAQKWREGKEEGRGGYFLAIKRPFNGVFQFPVAGNERKLKPGQIFIPEKRTRLEEKAERRGGVWRWMVVRINR